MYNTYKIIFKQNISATSDMFEAEEGAVEIYYCRSWYKDIFQWALEYISTMGAHGVTTYDMQIVAANIPDYIREKHTDRIIYL